MRDAAFWIPVVTRLWDYELAGALAMLPWFLPALIGIPGSVIWTAYYRRKFTRTAGRGRVTAPCLATRVTG